MIEGVLINKLRQIPDERGAIYHMLRRDNDHFIYSNNFSNDVFFKAEYLITDWSGIAYEYSFSTLRPTIFINTDKAKIKVRKPFWS